MHTSDSLAFGPSDSLSPKVSLLFGVLGVYFASLFVIGYLLFSGGR